MALLYNKSHLEAATVYALLVSLLVAIGILPWKRLFSGNANNAFLRLCNTCSLSTMPVWPYYSLPDIVLVVVYIVITALFSVTTISTLDDIDFPRFGYLALANLSVLTLLPLRNSPLSAILGISYERCLLFHALLGVVACLCSLFHGSLYLYMWGSASFLVESINSRAMIPYGLAAGSLFGLVFLTSAIPLVRRISFELFYWIHILSYPTVLVLLYFHTAQSPQFFIPGAVLYGLDRILRIVRALRPANIVDSCAVDNDMIRLTLFQPSFLGKMEKARAGQFVFIKIPDITPYEWHPFSIISPEIDFAAKNQQETAQSIELLEANSEIGSRLSDDSTPSQRETLKPELCELAIRKKGFFTKELHQFISSRRALSVFVDGPYGRAFDGVMDRDTVLLVAGGIGITPLLSILRTIMHRNQHALTGDRKQVGLVWVTRNPDHFNWFTAELTKAVSCGIQVHLHATCTYQELTQKTRSLPASVEYCKPDILSLMQGLQHRPNHNVSVAVCGPQSLVLSVEQAARRATSSDGMFVVFSETFSL
ncbi:hypothetical protein BATDEDRAFT_90468 [Batrachochytrium dendrobatidis JAM81]|uniref:FAD-binding FR-type domain-containing protein n=2 Tax=Batrachochytrium dendrobatidis TaxID=109871 RepID=F4P7S8_BATDJ|nr:uncharacterized protein BATDEDRAFT_90468 [Batrachochytrium dendrobatidis JAM81]EGF78713.1 hypothetical protein BATDEDRAFT_90468 [Batrachochytrium dendrobatidis JAM81]OAJ43654.1 hypothetical protein BDEG_26996 [Batrachochytrium dendrobatidis JEL423]|eukprot:XP_006680950.1 hypothetical protein BATDEDRAFT_90468 [Batrachochytrium dendrobatidis JAM81]